MLLCFSCGLRSFRNPDSFERRLDGVFSYKVKGVVGEGHAFMVNQASVLISVNQ